MAGKIGDSEVINCLKTYKDEATQARFERMEKNKQNFDIYHMRQDFSYKQKGQSREFLPKMSMAVEQGANFIQQGLVDVGDWFTVEGQQGIPVDFMAVKPKEIQLMLERQLEKADFYNFVGDSCKSGFVASLMIAKVHGKLVPKYTYEVKNKVSGRNYSRKLIRKENKVWELQISLVRQENYFPDPTGRGLYEMEDVYVDYYQLQQMAEVDSDYDKEVIAQLKGQHSQEGYDNDQNKARETDQNTTNHGFRSQVKLTEFYGNILGSDGELLMEHVHCVIANDNFIVKKPKPIDAWDGKSPYVVAPIVRVPGSVWHKALMDAPAMLNKAINEMFNLILDGGLMSVHGIKQIREHWLDDPSQIENGISAGDTLKVNSSCPPGASALERVDTSSVPNDGLNVMNLVNQEFYTAAMTNDLRMGVAPFRQVKATEVVEASQAITSMFAGIAKQIETKFVTPILEKSWKLCAQHMNDLDSDEVTSLLGPARAQVIQQMPNEDLFAATVQGCKFKVFGITQTLNRQKDFTKLTAFLQTISSSPVLMEEYVRKYDFGKLLGEILKSLDIKPYKLEHEESLEQKMAPQQQAGGGMQGAEMQNMQSQIPQAGAAGNQGDMTMESAIPRAEFPSSRATPSGGIA